MASHQPKVFKMDSHMGIAIAGLTADARYLTKFMRTECLNHRYVFGGPLQTQRLVQKIADKSQHHTQQYGKRPYGVGLLVIGYDQTGPHVFETDPAGNFFDYKAQAIGARSQAAKTYLEKKYKEFPEANLEDLIKHTISALRETIGKGKDEEKLSGENCAVGIVGEDQTFKILSVEEVSKYLEDIDQGVEAMETAE
jgi:20S proteasome subunit alpha 6